MEGKTEIDVIILSYARSMRLHNITKNCIRSLLASEDHKQVKFNIVVIESEKRIEGFQYPGSLTVYPQEDFAYNRFLNIGLEMTSAKYVCLCNNDLIFHRNWATEILKAYHRNHDLSSTSPACSKHHPRMGFALNSGVYTGNRSRYELAGWCLFLKRDVFRLIGKLDENYKFWCADNDYAHMISSSGLRHALVTSSIVDHLVGATIESQTLNSDDPMTTDEFFYFEKKWNFRADTSKWQEL